MACLLFQHLAVLLVVLPFTIARQQQDPSSSLPPMGCQPPRSWGNDFQVTFETVIPSEDVTFMTTVGRDNSNKRAIVRTTVGTYNDTTFMFNDKPKLVYYSTRGDAEQCTVFAVAAPLPQSPSFEIFGFENIALVNGRQACHLRGVVPDNFKPGLYTETSGDVLRFIGLSGMNEVLTILSYDGSPPADDEFELPAVCKDAEIQELPPDVLVMETFDATSTDLHHSLGISMARRVMTPASAQRVRKIHGDLKLKTYKNHSDGLAAFDVRNLAPLTPVRDQGSCGGCWAFSTVASIEVQRVYRRNISTSADFELSPQHLLDCVPPMNGTISVKGCFGGWPASAMLFIRDNKGLVLESTVPYMAVDEPCAKGLIPQNDTAIEEVYSIEAKDVKSIENAVVTYGAVTAIVQVLGDYVFYHEGVYNNPKCTGQVLSHAVTIVGFGETVHGEKYWVVKNSFGGDWGEGGYFRMARGVNMCGIEANVVFATLA